MCIYTQQLMSKLNYFIGSPGGKGDAGAIGPSGSPGLQGPRGESGNIEHFIKIGVNSIITVRYTAITIWTFSPFESTANINFELLDLTFCQRE